MRDKSDRYQIQTLPRLTAPKRLGSYLVEAGLLTPDQINVVLNDQQATGMRFGEIAIARGWIKEQTLEWIVEKVVEPERQLTQPEPQNDVLQRSMNLDNNHSAKASQAFQTSSVSEQMAASSGAASSGAAASQQSIRRGAPISKPLPPVNSSDNDVNWVG